MADNLKSAPWRIDFPASELGEIPYHVILGGSAVLEDPEGGSTRKLIACDFLLFPHGSAHALHDGSDATPAPARQRSTLTTVFRENNGTGDRLDMMCGRFILSAAHEHLIRQQMPPIRRVSFVPKERYYEWQIISKICPIVSRMRSR